jgi:hypothetical protein
MKNNKSEDKNDNKICQEFGIGIAECKIGDISVEM